MFKRLPCVRVYVNERVLLVFGDGPPPAYGVEELARIRLGSGRLSVTMKKDKITPAESLFLIGLASILSFEE